MTSVLLSVLIFWIILQIFNLIGLPITFRLLKNLPDRGYAFARAAGLLFSGYALWIAGSFGLLKNNLGGTILAMALVAALGLWWQMQRHDDSLREWLKTHWRYALTVEILFALALVGWAVFKSYNPAIETAGGEKWMEIAFTNSSLLSPTFPPQDPWLSGFGISYYYFGYVLMAMLTRLSGIEATFAFNLFIPTLFALTLTGAFGVVANLAASFERARKSSRSISSVSIRQAGLMGAIFVAIIGHWEGLLEVLHARGLMPAAFWTWLDIKDLNIPTENLHWIPDRFIWWWRGSRVIMDYNLAGQPQEMIDEFPFFSFMLGDVHPHVLALPFVLLAIALAMNLLFAQRTLPARAESWSARLADGFSALVAASGGRIAFGLTAIAIGALGFLNTWDLPIYLILFGLAFLVWHGIARLEESIIGMGGFAVLAIALYLPFYLSFQSQAGGILPNLWNPTRLPQFVVFFGLFLAIIIVFLWQLSRSAQWDWRSKIKSAVGFSMLSPIVLLVFLVLTFTVLPGARNYVQGILADPNVQSALNGASIPELLREILARRLGNPWTFLLLGGLFGWALAHGWGAISPSSDDAGAAHPAEKFTLILILMGLALPLSVEFIFLKDLFGTRMNTIFKFYFQAWVLLALASAFGVYYLSRQLKGTPQRIWDGALWVMIFAALIYPTLAIPSKAGNFKAEPTLNGAAWVSAFHPDDYAAIEWLKANTPENAIVLERPGKSYNYLNRVSALSGRATLVGWDFHEYQWRGSMDEVNRRQPDIETIFNGLSQQTTLTLLNKYDITYIYVGDLEREIYAANGLAKFNQFLSVAYQNNTVTIYKR